MSARLRSRPLFGLAVLAVLSASGCRVTDLPLWGLPAVEDCEAVQVQSTRGIIYHEGRDTNPLHHRLDIFMPKGAKDCPVVVLVHGGAWVVGDNRCCGLYSCVGEFLASHGIVAVLPNYRLSPAVRHPVHAQDVAEAVAWTRDHVAKHGGDPTRIFLAGHSAGGHLVSLLATDKSYLQKHGMEPKDIRGVISISGVYEVPTEGVVVTLGGNGEEALRVDSMLPLRSPVTKVPALLPGLPARIDVFTPAFGKQAKTRVAASPLTHVGPGMPPFLLAYGDADLPLLASQAKAFHRAIIDQGGRADLQLIPERNHNSIIFHAISMDDPLGRAMVTFVRKNTRAAEAEHAAAQR